MLDFTNVALRTLMCLAFLVWVVRPMLMSMVRREPNYLELEEMAQLAVNSAYRQQFASFYLPRPTEKSVTPKVEAVHDEVQAPVVLLTVEEQEALFLQEQAMALRYKGHEEELARRVLVAQALVHRPPVIVLDEPTAGVDVDLRRSLWEFISRLNAKGHTIILTTHYLEEAEMLCNRTAMLKGGRIVALDTTKALIARGGGNLEQAFVQIMNAQPSKFSEAQA